jgi:hypothetical protein
MGRQTTPSTTSRDMNICLKYSQHFRPSSEKEVTHSHDYNAVALDLRALLANGKMISCVYVRDWPFAS